MIWALHHLDLSFPWPLSFPPAPKYQLFQNTNVVCSFASVTSPGPRGYTVSGTVELFIPIHLDFPWILVSVTIFHLPARQIWPACFFTPTEHLPVALYHFAALSPEASTRFPDLKGRGVSLLIPRSGLEHSACHREGVNTYLWVKCMKSGTVFGTV